MKNTAKSIVERKIGSRGSMIGFRKNSNIPHDVYSNVMAFMDEAVIIIDDAHNIVFYNDSAERIFGYSREELAGKSINIIIPPREYNKHDKVMSDFSAKSSRNPDAMRKKVQVYGRRKDGSEFITSTTIVNASTPDNVYFAVLVRDISENKKTEEELLRLASTDPLTGVFNRREFRNIADKEVMRSKRYGRPLSVLMIDIDHFKNINDAYGHAAGDKALQHLTKICSTSLRTMDVVARWGGEEFLVLLPETDIKGAGVIAERLRKAVETMEFIHNNNNIDFTISLGITEYRQGDDTIDALLARVDTALYKAKNTGRNRVCASE